MPLWKRDAEVPHLRGTSDTPPSAAPELGDPVLKRKLEGKPRSRSSHALEKDPSIDTLAEDLRKKQRNS